MNREESLILEFDAVMVRLCMLHFVNGKENNITT